jgi:phosphoenolpyruvate synthase/pyruvate phosphate dikinase
LEKRTGPFQGLNAPENVLPLHKPGLAEGPARVVNGVKDFLKFQRGEILVFESIQPTMTHLVPLASAIVERRGAC